MANVAVIANYPLFHGFFPNGAPLIGGKLYTYEAGTSTPAAAYHDAAATIPHMNPIVLDDRGEALIFIRDPMLWVLTDADGVQLWNVDMIGGQGETFDPSMVGVNHAGVSIGLVG